MFPGGVATKFFAIGADKVKKLYVGSTQVWALVTFVASGLVKSGSFATSSGNAWSRLTGWTGSTGGTIIESDGIRVPEGLVVNYSVSVTFGADTGPSTTQGARLMNGIAIVNDTETSWTGYGNSSMTKSGTLTGTGELVTVEARASSSGSRGTVIAAGTSLTLTPVT